LGKYWPGINKFTVKEGNREMQVIIPKSGDSSYDEYLEEAEREKTADELKKNQKPEATMSKADVAGALREYAEFKRRGKKYF